MPTEGREQDIMTDQELRHISPQEVLDAINAAVDERGVDFVYPINWRSGFNPILPLDADPAAHGMCQNYLAIGEADEVQPACIAGYIYSKLGFLNELVKYNLNKASVTYLFALGTAGGGDKRKFDNIVLDDVSVRVLGGMQESQDSGDTWGVSRDENIAPLVAYIKEQAEQQAQFEADFGGENVGE